MELERRPGGILSERIWEVWPVTEKSAWWRKVKVVWTGWPRFIMWCTHVC